MRLPDFQYLEPRSIEEACLFLKEHGQETKIMGGGTDLLPSMKQKIFKPKYLVYLGGIPNLYHIEFNEGTGLRIGSMVKLRSLETDPVIQRRYPIIVQAAGEVGSVQVRQMGTVGGNLCLDTRCYYYNQTEFWRRGRPTCIKMGGKVCNAIGGGKKCFAVFSGDLAPVLIALGANIKLCSSWGERILPLSDFYSGDGAKPLIIKPEEVLVSVEVPATPIEALFTYFKYRIRGSIDFPLASVTTMMILDGKQRICHEAKVIIGAVGPKPEDVTGIREHLEGKRLESSLIDGVLDLVSTRANPVANMGSSPPCRRKMIKIFVKKAIQQALEK